MIVRDMRSEQRQTEGKLNTEDTMKGEQILKTQHDYTTLINPRKLEICMKIRHYCVLCFCNIFLIISFHLDALAS